MCTLGLLSTGNRVRISTLVSRDCRYGFGAPFLLGGPLEESDPGCGVEELQAVLERYPNLLHLPGTIYSALQLSGGAEDPYTLVEARHLPPVQMFDLKVIQSIVEDCQDCV